jgi:hypothetical protein
VSNSGGELAEGGKFFGLDKAILLEPDSKTFLPCLPKRRRADRR